MYTYILINSKSRRRSNGRGDMRSLLRPSEQLESMMWQLRMVGMIERFVRVSHQCFLHTRSVPPSSRALCPKPRLCPVSILQETFPGTCCRETHSVLQGAELSFGEKIKHQLCPQQETQIQAPSSQEEEWHGDTVI